MSQQNQETLTTQQALSPERLLDQNYREAILKVIKGEWDESENGNYCYDCINLCYFTKNQAEEYKISTYETDITQEDGSITKFTRLIHLYTKVALCDSYKSTLEDRYDKFKCPITSQIIDNEVGYILGENSNQMMFLKAVEEFKQNPDLKESWLKTFNENLKKLELQELCRSIVFAIDGNSFISNHLLFAIAIVSSLASLGGDGGNFSNPWVVLSSFFSLPNVILWFLVAGKLNLDALQKDHVHDSIVLNSEGKTSGPISESELALRATIRQFTISPGDDPTTPTSNT